ncbi:hypothetical protein Scep_028262 [Stephania cephalantha]|uniref:Uncharacterized protein n=1 Tax=Stephania cephalantha TaxID=152367 RepID=A0AAP0EBS6_9MAGN
MPRHRHVSVNLTNATRRSVSHRHVTATSPTGLATVSSSLPLVRDDLYGVLASAGWLGCPPPARAHPPRRPEKAETAQRETGRSMRSKYGFEAEGPCGGGRSGGTLGEGGGEDEAGKRTGSGIGRRGRREWRRKRDPTVEIWSWRPGRLGRGIGGISKRDQSVDDEGEGDDGGGDGEDS